MKLAIVLPGYLDSPDYLHMLSIEKGLQDLQYETVRLDPCKLWSGGNVVNYSITNYLKDVKETINKYKDKSLNELLLVGHSVGGFVAIIAAEIFPEVTRIVALCPPAIFDNPPVKWKDGVYRISKRELSEGATTFREFKVPISFAYDSFHYNAIEAIHKIDKPLMIFIALDDTIVPAVETEKLVNPAKHPYVVRLKGIRHDFRKSAKECEIVVGEIKKFLTSNNIREK